MATGRYEDNLFVSLRYARSLAHAGTLLAATVGELGSAGGHKRMAGGRIPFAEHSDEDWGHLEDILIARFLDELGYKKGVEWRPLLLKDSDL